MTPADITALPVAPSLLGESPLWHPDEQVLYWVDIPGQQLNRFNPADGHHDEWHFPSEPACCAPLLGGGLLLAMRDGVELTEMAEARACCGFGGTFAVKYGDISTAIVDDKCANIHDSGADTVVLGDLGCMLNIEGRLRRNGDHKTRVLHVAQVLSGDA